MNLRKIFPLSRIKNIQVDDRDRVSFDFEIDVKQPPIDVKVVLVQLTRRISGWRIMIDVEADGVSIAYNVGATPASIELWEDLCSADMRCRSHALDTRRKAICHLLGV